MRNSDANFSFLFISDHDAVNALSIEDFATKTSMLFFKVLDIEPTFLDKTPKHWHNDDAYIKCKEIVQSLPVANDLAKRGVKFVTDHLLKVTKDEDQFKAMLINEWDFRKNSIFM